MDLDAIDSFLLNKKGLEELSILHKNFCNMHIARRNMHIATESILRLTHTLVDDSLYYVRFWEVVYVVSSK